MRTPSGWRTQRGSNHRDTETLSQSQKIQSQKIQPKKISVSLCLRGLLTSVFSLSLCVGAFAQSASWPTERPPQPLPARDIKFPPYEI